MRRSTNTLRCDAEKDFHGFTAVGMLDWLNREWASRRWDGIRRVRIIHGRGEVLIPCLRRWCEEKGISWAADPGNPGATILHPSSRAKPIPPPRNLPLRRPLLGAAGFTQSRAEEACSADGSDEQSELFEREVERLSGDDHGGLLRRKHL